MVVPEQSEIAESAKACLAGLTSLSESLKSPETQSKFDLSYDESCGHVGRFRIWANNIGALQDASRTTSLEYRLRDAPKIVSRILELLDDMEETLGDISSILSGERENRTGTLGDSEDEYSEDSESDSHALPEPPSGPEMVSEVKELFQSIGDTISGLFKISVLIRGATPRDRYARAANANKQPFDEQFDIAHVGHKHPKVDLESQEWLKIRLGNAITKRRQYLRYCRDHHAKLAMEPQAAPKSLETEAKDLEINRIQTSSIAIMSTKNSQTIHNKPASTLAPTMASTLMPAAFEAAEDNMDDTQSQMSEATSMAEDESNQMKIESLDSVSKGSCPFECPYCYGIQNIKRERSWRKHVLRDLKAYVCTFPDPECELKMFEDRAVWFAHELDHHRLEWKCHFCLDLSYGSKTEFEDHLRNKHMKQIQPGHIEAISKVSQRSSTRLAAAACPLCDEWNDALRKANPQVKPEEVLTVTTNQFRHHLGNHLEQLALFAIPRATDVNDEEPGSAAAAVGADEEQSSYARTIASVTVEPNSDQPNPLHEAASKGLEWEVQRLVENGSDVNSWDDTFGTPLHAAVGGDFHNVVQVLVNSGADVFARNAQQDSALAIAVKRGKLSTVRYFLDLPQYQEPESGRDELPLLLEYAASKKKEISQSILRSALFIEAGTDLMKSQALLTSIKHGNVHMVDLLLARNADPNIRDDDGNTALLLAATSGDPLILQNLIYLGANVNDHRRGGFETPLFNAVTAKHWEVVRLLLGHGAKPDQRILLEAADNEEMKELLSLNMPSDRAFRVFDLSDSIQSLDEAPGTLTSRNSDLSDSQVSDRGKSAILTPLGRGTVEGSSLQRARPVRSSSVFTKMVQSATRDDRLLVEGQVMAASAIVERLNQPESVAEDYPMSVVEALVQRLGVPMASIQKRTVSLAHYLAKFGGDNMRQGLLSVEFLYALASLAARETVSDEVKEIIVQTLTDWAERFEQDYDTSAVHGALMACFEVDPLIKPSLLTTSEEPTPTLKDGDISGTEELSPTVIAQSQTESSTGLRASSMSPRIELLNSPDTSTVAYVNTVVLTSKFSYDLVRSGGHTFMRKVLHGSDTKAEDLLRELRFLGRLRHNHIMKRVSSHSLRSNDDKPAIYLQPPVQTSLGQFLNSTEEGLAPRVGGENQGVGVIKSCIAYFFSCMASALESVHRKSITHGGLDSNAFFASFHPNESAPELKYRIYLGNFGNATVTNTGGKETGAADLEDNLPVFINSTTHRAEDILGLGLIFVDMMAAISNKPRQRQLLAEIRSKATDTGQVAMLSAISDWAETFSSDFLENSDIFPKGATALRQILPSMLAILPWQRPHAEEVLNALGGQNPCCASVRPPSPTGEAV